MADKFFYRSEIRDEQDQVIHSSGREIDRVQYEGFVRDAKDHPEDWEGYVFTHVEDVLAKDGKADEHG